MDKKKLFISLFLVLLLVVGLGIGIYLVQTQQIFRSRATGENFINAFEIKDAGGNTIHCDATTNPPTCVVPTRAVQVQLVNPSLLVPTPNNTAPQASSP